VPCTKCFTVSINDRYVEATGLNEVINFNVQMLEMSGYNLKPHLRFLN
jgi:hypothetical protein